MLPITWPLLNLFLISSKIFLKNFLQLKLSNETLKFKYQNWVFFTRFYLFTFRERGGREKEKERNIDVWEKHWLVASHVPPTGDLAHNSGMCPVRESNQWHFGSYADTQSTRLHPGPKLSLLIFNQGLYFRLFFFNDIVHRNCKIVSHLYRFLNYWFLFPDYYF